MLNKREKIVMKYIYSQCNKKGTCLLSDLDISTSVAGNIDVNAYEVNDIINNLVLENLISVVNSEKLGRPVYCITLNTLGESFQRDLDNQKKGLIKKLMITIVFACISFIVTCILKAIFF